MKITILTLLLLSPFAAHAADEWTTDNPNDLKGGFGEFSKWEGEVDDACRPGRLGSSHTLAASLLPAYSIQEIADSQKKETDAQVAVEHLDLVNLDYAHVTNDSFRYRQLCTQGDGGFDKMADVLERLQREWSEYDGNDAKLEDELQQLIGLVKSPADYNRYDKACEGALNRALLGVKRFHRNAVDHRAAECNPAK